MSELAWAIAFDGFVYFSGFLTGVWAASRYYREARLEHLEP